MSHCTTCLTIVFTGVEAGNYFKIVSFYWLHDRNNARQIPRGVLHCAMAKKCVIAALRHSLRKVEPESISCNASCNKNVA